MARVALTERMAQDGPIPVAKAAQDCYQNTIAWHCSDVQSDPLGFYKWFQESKHRDFLTVLATAIIVELDARSSTGTASSVAIQLSQIPVQLLPAKPKRSSMAESIARRQSNQSQQLLPSQVELQMPRVNRIDALAGLMKDKVQLLHILAEYQEERLEEVTGQLLEPFNEATVAAAACQAAQEARREYYFRPHGLSLAAVDLSWVVGDELLDPRSEKALFGEVMDQIERLKIAVDKLKPKKRNPW